MMSATAGGRIRTGTRLAPRYPGLISAEGLAARAGLHPELVARLLNLGLIEPRGGTRAAPLFRPQDAALLARVVRLRRDLGLNYAGAVLACELLARIDDLEERLRLAAPAQTQPEVITWTQIV